MAELNDFDWECIQKYADHDMNAEKAAKSMYVTPNAMSYHLSKVRKITGRDPRRFYDLVALLKEKQPK